MFSILSHKTYVERDIFLALQNRNIEIIAIEGLTPTLTVDDTIVVSFFFREVSRKLFQLSGC